MVPQIRVVPAFGSVEPKPGNEAVLPDVLAHASGGAGEVYAAHGEVRATEQRWVDRAPLCLSALLVVGCLAKTDGADGGVYGAPSNDETSLASESDDDTAACVLREATSNPTVTLSGRLCGETISVTTRAGTAIQLGRSRATDPETEVRIVEVGQYINPSAPLDFETAEFLVNLAFETGPEVASSVSTHTLASGVFSLCGFGTVVLQSGPVVFEVSGVEDGASSGDIALTFSGMLVGGYAPQHAQSRVQPCGGEVDLTLRGRFVHR